MLYIYILIANPRTEAHEDNINAKDKLWRVDYYSWIPDARSVHGRYLYKMVAQNMLRTYDVKSVLTEKKSDLMILSM